MKKNQSFPRRSSKLVVTSFFVTMLLSCAKVNFGTKSTADTPGDPGVTDLSVLQCDVFLNNNQTSVTITASSQNPTVTGKCNPSQVDRTWTVTKGDSKIPVTISGLQGEVSTPDFFVAGNGTYSVVLNATANGYKPFQSAPVTVVVASGGGGPVVQPFPNPTPTPGPNPTPTPTPTPTPAPLSPISCNVKMNGNLTTVDIVTNKGPNPTVMAVCNPADGAYVWTVTKGGVTVNVPSLNGSQSTPDFASMPPGNYQIYVRVTKDKFTPFELTSPLTVNVTAPALRAVTLTKTATLEENQLDILLVLDDSNSMLADNRRLAQRLQGFVTDLSAAGLDWQMCVTTSRAQQYAANDPTLYWGSSVIWSGGTGATPWVLKPSTANLNQVFVNTIEQIGAGWVGSDDERGIKAAWWHLWNGDPSYSPNSNCYRQQAGLAVVVVSDEDERSIGGDKTQQYYANEYFSLESDDLPSTYISYVKQILGAQKRFTVNSIIVRPGDNACLAQQDAEGSKAHYGTKYAELSAATNGFVGSICDTDYSSNLKYFKDNIVRQMKSVPLECAPVGNITVSASPNMAVTTSVTGTTLNFSPAIPVGTTVTVNYSCAQ